MAALQTDDRGIITNCPACGQKNRLAYERLTDTVRCGRCKAELPAASAPVDVADAADFDHLVASSAVSDRRRFLGAVVRAVPDGGARA